MPRKKKNINPICGLRVKQILKEQHMTQAALAEKIHTSKQHMCEMANGKQNITKDTAIIISEVFSGEYSVGWIMGIDNYQNDYELESWNRLDELLTEQSIAKLMRRRSYFVDLPKTTLIEDPDNPSHFQRAPIGNGTVTIRKEGMQLILTFTEYQEFCNEICDYVDYRVNRLLKKRGGTPIDK